MKDIGDEKLKAAIDKKAERWNASERLAKNYFLSLYAEEVAYSVQQGRYEAIRAELSYLEPFDANDVLTLFFALEERACAEINKWAVLAQTLDPDALLKHGIPGAAINNAKSLREHHRKAAKSDSAANARASMSSSMDEIAFKGWVKEKITMETYSGKIQVVDLPAISGFQWSRRSDGTLKTWLKSVYPDFQFKRGRATKK